MSALHRCVRCRGGSWSIEREDQSVTALCLVCGGRVLLRDSRREAAEAELAAIRGRALHGPQPRIGGG